MREDDFVVLMPYSRGKQAAMASYYNDFGSSGPEYKGDCIDGLSNGLSNGEDKKVSKEYHGICKPPGCKEMEDQNLEFDASGNVPDSVWNEIAADLSDWKAANSLNDVGQSSLNKPPEAKGAISSKTTNTHTSIDVVLEERPAVEQLSSNCGSCVSKYTSSEKSHIFTEQEQSGSKKRKRARKTWSCPAVLERLHEIYKALNLVYGFLQKQHMQGTWQNMKTALQRLCGASNEEIKIEEIETLASFFPKVMLSRI